MTYIHDFLRKAKNTIKLVINQRELLKGESYYPDEPRKSKIEIFLDQLYFVLKSGNVEKFYYAYGFDRKGMHRKQCVREYIINENVFLYNVDYYNKHMKGKPNMVPGRVIIADKFYFYLFLKSLGFPTPGVLYYTRDGLLLYSIDNQNNTKWGG